MDRRKFRRSIVVTALLALPIMAGCRQPAKTEPSLSLISLRRDASRFAIAASTDTTVTFRPAEARWLKVGMSGRVVDPVQGDALIAQITIEKIDQNSSRATIVGAVSPVTAASHVILFEKPAKSWWRDNRFWIGAAAGAAAGVIAGSSSK